MYQRKKARLHLLLIASAALGSCASVLSGSLAAIDDNDVAAPAAATAHA